MKIDLLSIYDKNKKLEQKEKEIKKELEKAQILRDIMCAVINGDESVEIKDDDLAKEIGVKTFKQKCLFQSIYVPKQEYRYYIELTKENIKKIQTYLEKRGE